ncbi:MAG: hypothetical protein INR71_06260 [Terriglobus roseus]|nr:hypothetical protein [Terriglobus roseus]
MSAMDVDQAARPQSQSQSQSQQQAQIQPCRYKTGKTLGAGSYSVVKECVHIDTGRYYAAKVINKRLMAGREHMVRNEIAVLKKVSMGHQNILTLVDYFETMNNRTPRVPPSVSHRSGKSIDALQCTSSPTSPWAASSSTAYAERAATTRATPPTSSAPPCPPSPTCTTTASCTAT